MTMFQKTNEVSWRLRSISWQFLLIRISFCTKCHFAKTFTDPVKPALIRQSLGDGEGLFQRCARRGEFTANCAARALNKFRRGALYSDATGNFRVGMWVVTRVPRGRMLRGISSRCSFAVPRRIRVSKSNARRASPLSLDKTRSAY